MGDVTGEIGVFDFKIGQSLQAEYINPDSGRVRINFYDSQNNIVLHFNPRWDEGALVLNSKINGSYGPEERPPGYNFNKVEKITARFLATQTAICIFIDERMIYEYKNRLPVTSIIKVDFAWYGGSGTPAKLQCFEVRFSS